MKRIFLIWFAISVTIFVLFGVTLNYKEYLQHVSNNLPNVTDLYIELVTAIGNFKDLAFNGVGGFKDVIVLIGGFFNIIWQVLLVPIKLIIFIVKVLIAFLPLGSFKTL